VVGDLERDVGRERERLAEREVVAAVLQLRDRSLVGLRVLARERDEPLAEPARLRGGPCRIRPVRGRCRSRRELDE
jgi:hypothetical protein